MITRYSTGVCVSFTFFLLPLISPSTFLAFKLSLLFLLMFCYVSLQILLFLSCELHVMTIMFWAQIAAWISFVQNVCSTESTCSGVWIYQPKRLKLWYIYLSVCTCLESGFSMLLSSVKPWALTVTMTVYRVKVICCIFFSNVALLTQYNFLYLFIALNK